MTAGILCARRMNLIFVAETLCQQDVTSRTPGPFGRPGEVTSQTGGTMVSGNSSRYSVALPVAPFGRSSAFSIVLGFSTENLSAAGIVRRQHVLPAAVVRTKMAKSRLELRKMHDAAEAAGISDNDSEETPKKKKATRKKAAPRKVREKAPERKRAVWVLYSGSMKEEGRYPYDQKEAAEERLAILQGRGKKLYFMQMVKELITGSGDSVQVIEPALDDDDDDDDVVIRKASVPKDEDELGDVEVDDADFEDDDDDEEEGLDDDPDDD